MITDRNDLLGLTPRQAVAIQANLRSNATQALLGYSGTYNSDPMAGLTNLYYKALITYSWTATTSASGMAEYVAKEPMTGKAVYMTPTDMVVSYDPVYLAIAQEFAVDRKAFTVAFRSAWTKMMNADRFDGPVGNVCDK